MGMHKQQDHSEQKHDTHEYIAPKAPKQAQDVPNTPIPTQTPSQPLPAVPAHAAVSDNAEPLHVTGGGNGQIWCTSSSSPGWNISTNKCDYAPTNAITPKVEKMSATSTVAPQFIRLDQLPYSGTNDVSFYTGLFGAMVFSVVAGYYLAMWTRRV